MSVRRGALITIAFHWTTYGVAVASIVLLTRVLHPADYGLVAMVTAIVGAAAIVGDFGLSLAALQAPSLSQQAKTNLFWLNLGVGAGTSLLLCGLSSYVAKFYQEPRLTLITISLASVFTINAAAVQFKVELNRNLQFVKLGVVDVGAQVVGLGVALWAAVAGHGYWALIWQQMAAAAVGTALSVMLAQWLPGRPHNLRAEKDLLSFGRDTFLVQIVNYVTSNADTVALGRSSGAGTLGLYNRSYQIAVLPVVQVVAPLTRVFVPRLSGTSASEFEALIVRLQSMIVYLTLAPLSLLVALHEDFPSLVFGPQWAAMSQIIPILALGTLFASLGFVYYWAFLARAATRQLFYSELVGRAPMLVLIILLAPFGSFWVGTAVAIGQILVWLSSTFIFGPTIDIRASSILIASRRGVTIFSFALIASLLAQRLTRPLVAEPMTLSLGLVVWLVVVAIFQTQRSFRMDTFNLVGMVRKRRPL